MMRLDKYQVLRLPTEKIDAIIAETRDQRAMLLLARNHLLNDTSERVDKEVRQWQAEIDALQVKIERAYSIHRNKETQLTKNWREIQKADDYIQFLNEAKRMRQLEAKERHIKKLQKEIADKEKRLGK